MGLVGGVAGGWVCVVVWLVGPSLWAPFPLTLTLSHGGERGLLVVVWCCCIGWCVLNRDGQDWNDGL